MPSLTADSTRAPVARIDNPGPDTEFSTITVHPGGTRPILRDEHRAPHNDAGQEFCVAWWLRSGCLQNCGRRAAHVPFSSSTAERVHLLSFCREHLAAPATSGDSTWQVGQVDSASVPPGTSAESAWLLNAPPWEVTGPSNNRKREASQISIAKQTLGKKLAAAMTETAQRFRWSKYLEQLLLGKSNQSTCVGAVPHKAARLLEHLH